MYNHIPVSENMKKVLADEPARNQLYEFMLSKEQTGSIQLSDGTKFNISYVKNG
ncbi:hypothetical protein SCRM01_154c [Synechococcus phage S-CRM01]|uniref:hypothetical protein n=1 Tax=Synechococcus phage S-CRM01 TaxID=1026955 RepID=UPI000209E3EB|nr:hypothetical protein SCRM01_154c [Synechococcus phage S-CRM01]AEC53100.1 hypothetical protein SCRM01_154c [Synechococcus phage S-CRM01]